MKMLNLVMLLKEIKNFVNLLTPFSFFGYNFSANTYLYTWSNVSFNDDISKAITKKLKVKAIYQVKFFDHHLKIDFSLYENIFSFVDYKNGW